MTLLSPTLELEPPAPTPLELEPPASASLECELAGLLRAARLEPRQARAVAIRLGWGGAPPSTLAAAGRVEDYTRERVRQLERRVLAHVAETRPELPATTAALRLLAEAAPAPRRELARRLAEAGISARPFDPEGVVAAAAAAGLDSRVVVLGRLVLGREEAAAATRAASLARGLVARHGATRVSTLLEELGDRRLRAPALRRVLELTSRVTWLDDRRSWFAVPVKRGPLTTALRKMLAVTGSLHLADVEAGLLRGGRPVVLPRRVLRPLCASLDWVSVDADVVSAAAPLDPERVLTPLERALVDVFRSSGPELGWGTALRLAEATGVNAQSAALYLSRSPVFQAVARGRYALRGHVPAMATA